MRAAFLALPVLLAAAPDPAPLSAAQAVALADAHPERGTSGVFTVTIAAAQRSPNMVYLNSMADYRAPGDLTIDLSLAAAKSLEKRLGGRPETALLGRTITVRGAVEVARVYNTVAGRPASFNRGQHHIRVTDASRITVG